MRIYNHTYSYDKLGNVNTVKQSGTNGFTRNFNYNAGVNTLYELRDSCSTLIEDFTYEITVSKPRQVSAETINACLPHK